MAEGLVDVAKLQREAEAALQAGRGVSGGWSTRIDRGRAYNGARFAFDGRSWVVVAGPQRAASAQLLDATACLKTVREADCGVAVLGPPGDKQPPTPEEFRCRYQAAVWGGRDIVAVEVGKAAAPWSWTPEMVFQQGDIDSLAADVRAAIESDRRRRPRSWDEVVQQSASRKAEALVRDAVIGTSGPKT
jgi:hypothetical protein